jgi:uroporphyrinogen decarboxylase
VRRHVEAFAPGGGYVFAPVHNIQAGVPPENIEAMFDTALSWRGATAHASSTGRPAW